MAIGQPIDTESQLERFDRLYLTCDGTVAELPGLTQRDMIFTAHVLDRHTLLLTQREPDEDVLEADTFYLGYGDLRWLRGVLDAAESLLDEDA